MNKQLKLKLLQDATVEISACARKRKEITPIYNGDFHAVYFNMFATRQKARTALENLANNVAVMYLQFWDWDEYVPTIAGQPDADMVIDSNFEWDEARGKFVLQNGKSFSPEFLLSIRFPNR